MDCENCGRTNEPGARYCASCGVELSQGPGDSDQAESRPEACPNCGATNAPGAAYCAACGVSVGAASTAAQGGDGSISTRGLGALLDESFQVYRANFLPFIAIMALPQVANVLSSIFFQVESGPAILIGFILLLATIMLSIVAAGAMVFGVARHYTRGGVDVMDCLSHAFQVAVLLIAQGIVVMVVIGGLLLVGGILFILGIVFAGFAAWGGNGDSEALGVIFIIVGLLLTLLGLVIAIWLGVNWFCGSQAVVIEGKGPVAGLGRSWNLVRGSWWRVFGIGLVVAIIVIVAGTVIAIPIGVIAGIAAFASGEAFTLVGAIAGAVATILTAPFAYIAGTLLYFDLRVRKEGFDLDVLADETSRV